MALPFKPAAGGSVTVGGTVSGATDSSVLYVGTGGVLAQDTSLAFGGASNPSSLRLGKDFYVSPFLSGLGVSTAPALVIGANDANGDGPRISMMGNDNLGVRPTIVTYSSQGTMAAPTFSTAGDRLFVLDIRGAIGSPTATIGSFAALWGMADLDGDTATFGRLSLRTAGGSAPIERLRLTSAGTTALATPQSGTSIALVGPFEIQGTSERWVGSTSGVLTHAWPATITSHTLTWPAANAPGALRNDGAGALSWAAPVTISDVTSARALDTTYANAYSNKAVLVFATVRCTTSVGGGSATVTPKASTSATPTTVVGGNVGLASGLLLETNAFQICFPVSAGSSMNYRLDSTSNNGTVSLTAWHEVTL